MTPHPIELHDGSQVRLRRNVLGMSLETLAAEIGVTYQQLQKYEHAVNGISASRLYELAQALKVPVSYFFDELTQHDLENRNERAPPGAGSCAHHDGGTVQGRSRER